MKKYLFLCVFLIQGCSSNTFLDYYNEEQAFSANQTECEKHYVQIIETSDLKSRIKKYQDKRYEIIGFSEFEDEWEPRSFAIETVKEKNACLIIIESSLSGTQERSYLVAIPSTGYAYHSNGISSTYTSYSYVNSKYHVNIYKQKAVFMAKKKENK